MAEEESTERLKKGLKMPDSLKKFCKIHEEDKDNKSYEEIFGKPSNLPLCGIKIPKYLTEIKIEEESFKNICGTELFKDDGSLFELSKLPKGLTESIKIDEKFFKEISKSTEAFKALSLDSLKDIKAISDAIPIITTSNIKNLIPDVPKFLESEPFKKGLSSIKTLELSTGIFKNMIGSVNSITYPCKIFPEYPTVPDIKKRVSPKIAVESELDILLKELNPSYPAIKRAAWQTLESDNEDKVRQSIVSMRELMSMVLRDLAPDEKTRKQKIESILFKKDKEQDNKLLEFVNSVLDTTDKSYEYCCKITHTINKNENYAKFTLAQIEGVLLLILKERKNYSLNAG